MNGDFGDYTLLVEKEEIWARMLAEVLEDNGIPCAMLPIYGAGLSMKVGMQDWYKVFVPKEHLETAKDLVDELFSAGYTVNDDN